jgi:flagellar protein FlgJ
MSSVFTDLSRFVPMQDAQDARFSARLTQAKQQLQAAGKGAEKAKGGKDPALLRACTDFEAIFIKQMLNAMRKTIDKKNDLIQPDMANNIFEDMLYDEYSRKMAKTGHFGIADMLYNQFTQKTIQPTA